jgi:hypothetical protein
VPDVRVRAVLCGVLGGAWSASAMAQAPAVGDSGGRVTFRVLPETVTVGQPFVVNLRAIPSAGRTAVAPPVPDTGGIVEPLDPAVVSRRGDTLLVRYRLIAWQPGVLNVPLAPVQMRSGNSEIAVPSDIRVVVASVLPQDSASRVPKGPRELMPIADPWWAGWWRWMFVLLGALGLIALWHWWRTRPAPAKDDVSTPLSRAEEAFARLDARELIAAGEGGRHAALATEIVRQYLADIEPSLSLTLTNRELLDTARPIAGIPALRLAQLLESTDRVRFSGRRAAPESIRRVSGLARELVREMDAVRRSLATEAA